MRRGEGRYGGTGLVTMPPRWRVCRERWAALGYSVARACRYQSFWIIWKLAQASTTFWSDLRDRPRPSESRYRVCRAQSGRDAFVSRQALMFILFDQVNPVGIRPFLKEHKVETAALRGWDKLKNGELLKAAEEAGFINQQCCPSSSVCSVGVCVSAGGSP